MAPGAVSQRQHFFRQKDPAILSRWDDTALSQGLKGVGSIVPQYAEKRLLSQPHLFQRLGAANPYGIVLSENTDDSAHGTLCHKTRYLQRQTEEQK